MADIFISYRSYDRPWAERLYRDLQKYYPTIDIFWDRTSIQQEANYADLLKTEERKAKHLIILWSDRAAESQEVRDEVSVFHASRDAEPTRGGKKRVLFYLPLEGEMGAYLEQRQGLTELRDLGTYDSNVTDRGISKLENSPDREAWQRILQIVGEEALSAEDTYPVNLAILVTASSNLDALQFFRDKRPGPNLPTASEYAAASGLTFEAAVSRYGDTAFDWRPFGSDQTIIHLMQSLRMEMNSSLDRYRFHWVPYDLLVKMASFGSDNNAMHRWLDELTKRPLLLIVDALSLFNPVIQTWLPFLGAYATREHLVIVSLAHQEAPSAKQLYDVLRVNGNSVFGGYFNPPIPLTGTSALCGINIGHVPDIERLVRTSLGIYFLKEQKIASKPLTTMGA